MGSANVPPAPSCYILVADLHGDGEAFRALQAHSRTHSPDAEIVLLGDYLDARISKRDVRPGRAWPYERTVDPDPPLWAALAGHRRVLGNQEERIRATAEPATVPAALAGLLTGPRVRRVAGAGCLHGDQFAWDKESWTPVLPLPPEVADARLLFFGHSHRAAAYRLTGAGLRPLEWGPGEDLGVPAAGRFLVNVPAAHAERPGWVTYRPAERTVRWDRLDAGWRAA